MIEFFHHGAEDEVIGLLEQGGGLGNAFGNGVVHCFGLFGGLYVMRMQLEIKSCVEARSLTGMIEINFCLNGRFETQFSMRNRALLKPGDMAISCYDGLHGSKSRSCFPLGFYEGVCLTVEPKAAHAWIERNLPAFSLDFESLKQNLLGDKWYMCCAAGPRCEHVFRELYEGVPSSDIRFLRLKAIELLMLLGRIPRIPANTQYCSASQMEIVLHVRDRLIETNEKHITLCQLADESGMSVSHLQKLFKQVYGVPIYHYVKEYRLEQAAVDLARSSRSVTKIAQSAGYDNPSKFSECFRKRYGVTPSQYRAEAVAKQSIGTKTE